MPLETRLDEFQPDSRHDRPDSARTHADSAPTTLRSVAAVKPIAFLSDPSGSQVTLSIVSEHRARGCHILQVRTTGPDVSAATSLWVLAYVCLAFSLIVLAWARMPVSNQRPQARQQARQVVHAAMSGVGLAVLAILILDQVVVDTLSTPTAIDDSISAFAGSLAFMAVAIVVAPIAEEVWFRRFWLERFAGHGYATLGAVFVSLMFCALHVPGSAHPLASILCTAALSALCCIVYLRSRSIGPPLMLHSAYNATIVISQA